jgi:energy-coupling factor transporter ATP-binding protein EcfA2
VLKTIRLKNFKLHEDTTIEAGKITVFIGPNNSGKSSIFQALLVLKQAGRRGVDDRLVVPHRRESATQEQPFLYAELHGPIVDLGGYRDVVRDPSRELQIGADVELPPDLGAIGIARDMGVLQVGFDVWFRENCLIRHGGSFACAYGQTTRWVWAAGDPSRRRQSS